VSKRKLVLIMATSALLCGSAGQAQAQSAPSWCTSQQASLNPAESTICDSKRLWALDSQLSRVYRLVLKSGDDPDDAKASERDWLRARNGCEADATCLEALYKSRIAFLSGLANNAGPPAGQPPTAGQPTLAQTCGWYAITSCSTSKAEANTELARLQECCRASKTYPEVIHTDNFPNFRPGFYCVAVGPDTQEAAKDMADGYKGDFPTAYSKKSC
jgi:uncharacterized protein